MPTMRDRNRMISRRSIQQVRFNNGISGSNAFSFARNSATRDGLGEPVEANQPRFDRLTAYSTRHVGDEDQLLIASTSSNLLWVTGPDYDDTNDRGFLFEYSSNKIKVYDSSKTVLADHSYAAHGFDLMKGTISGKTFIPSAGVFCHGALVVVCRRKSGASDEGIALLLSTDYGASFSVIQDGSGNNTFPNLQSGQTRGTFFCLQNVFELSSDKTSFSVVWTDYLQNPGADGGQTGYAEFRRTAGQNDWSSPGARLVFEVDGEPSHFHCAGCAKHNGKIYVVTSVGDTTDDNYAALHVLTDSDNYMTCSIEENRNFHGARNEDVNGLGTKGHQFTSIALGSEPMSFIVGSDFDNEVITEITIPTGQTTANTFAQVKHLWGIRSSENFNVVKSYRGNHYISGDRKSGASENFLMYSGDGVHWFEIMKRTSGGVPFASFFGKWVTHVKPGEGIRAFPIPSVKTTRPLLIGRGSTNRVGAWSQWTGPESGCSLTKLVPNGNGKYEYPTGHVKAGQELPSQPQSMTEVWWAQSDGTNDDIGRYFLSPNSPSDLALDGSVIFEVFSLENAGAELRVMFDEGNSNVQVNSLPTECWIAYHVNGDVRANARPTTRIQSRSGTSTKPSSVLVTIPEHSVGLSSGGIPTAALSTSEDEVADFPATLVNNWKFDGYFGIPYFGQIDNSETNQIVSIVKDANNHIEVARTAVDTIRLTVTVDSVATSATGTFRLTQSSFGTSFAVEIYPQGNDTIAVIRGVEKTTITVNSQIVPGDVDVNLSANHDHSEIGIHQVFEAQVQ